MKSCGDRPVLPSAEKVTPTSTAAPSATFGRRRVVVAVSGKRLAINGEPKAGGVRLRPGERRDQREVGTLPFEEAQLKSYTHLYVIGSPFSPTRASSSRSRLRWAWCQPPTSGDAGPDDGRPAEEHAVEPDFQRLWICRRSQVESAPPDKPRRGASVSKWSCSASISLIRSRWIHRPQRQGQRCAMLDARDTDYNGLCFRASQALFPRTAAWNDLKKSAEGRLRRHGLGPSCRCAAPFQAGEHKQIAVKVIDDRGNELLVVKSLSDTRRVALDSPGCHRRL